MTLELSIIGGMGMIAAILSYMTFQFLHREQEQEGVHWERIIGMVCLLLTIIFINMIMYALLLIAQNNALTYMNDTFLRVGFIAIMWSTLGSMALYVLMLTIGSLYYLYGVVRDFKLGRNRKKGDF